MQIQKLKEKWISEGICLSSEVNEKALESFQNENNLILPNDFKEYLQLLDETSGKCTNNLYAFYCVSQIKKVSDEFSDWEGTPNYQSLLALNKFNNFFVFANYSFNLFAYAINLYSCSKKNEVYVFCGEHHKKIADSFTEFIDLYLSDSIDLYL